jgi:hypothetical protein
MIFNDYTFGSTQVTATAADTTNSNYLWIAFAQSNGSCILQKVSAYNLKQVYYTISVPVTSINAMVVYNGYLYCAVTHASIFAYSFSVTNPLTVNSTMNIPVGVTEAPIQIAVGTVSATPYVAYLLPGITTANAKIVLSTPANVYSTTITLLQASPSVSVTLATSFTFDAASNLWVVTNTAPVKLIRVYKVGSTWTLASTTVT